MSKQYDNKSRSVDLMSREAKYSKAMLARLRETEGKGDGKMWLSMWNLHLPWAPVVIKKGEWGLAVLGDDWKQVGLTLSWGRRK